MQTPPLPPFDHNPKPYTGPSPDEVLELRRQFLNPGIFLYYKKPLMLVEGKGQYVFDEHGQRYLDGLGGIVTVSVGHCHPHVVEAARRQNETLQHSTSIYLHPNIVEYARMLASKMPGELTVCYFVNSGSEANDLALLMARAFTGNFDAIALRNGYHGGSPGSMSLTAHSTWKFNVPHSFGVHHAITPDPYRGAWGRSEPDAGRNYAADVKSLIDYATSGRVAAFIAESIQGVGGCIVYPPGYLQAAYHCVRAAGGLCIADEVQTGFGRTGTLFACEQLGMEPDLIVSAKSIAAGLPLGAVTGRAEIMDAATPGGLGGTYVGNPVACEAALAVLKMFDDQQLVARAVQIGEWIVHRTREWAARFPLIGDIRGMAAMRAFELVGDRGTRKPAKEETDNIIKYCWQHGLIILSAGTYGNVIRLLLPLVVTDDQLEEGFSVLEAALTSVPAPAAVAIRN